MTTTTTLSPTDAKTASSDRAEALKAAAVALVLGVGIVFTTGFAGADVLHNAAHDSRHALSFPCH